MRVIRHQCTEWLWEIVPLTLAASRGVNDLYKTQNTRERFFFFVKLSINNDIVR